VNSDELLDALDPEQRLAAETLIGPVCILAGAGTGKTRTVTHRIAHGIASGYYTANRVMALTYTNRAAGELRSRLRQLGTAGVSVKTFHAAALSQLQFFWPQYAGVPAPIVIDSKVKLIAKAAEGLRLKFDTAAVRDIAAEIEWRKYSMLSLEEYEARVATRGQVGGLSPEVNLKLQRAYEAEKISANRLDWEDVLILNLGLLSAEPRALAHVHQQYRFYTVDEYQDISPLQHALLDAWLGDHTDLCVVGDPNQTIYSFTGATSEFLHGFADRFESANVVQLTRNYRSTQEIVAYANRLTSDVSRLEPLSSEGALGTAPSQRAYPSIAKEASAVASQIEDKLKQGTPAHEIAVLYRVNGQSEPLEHALSERGIDYQVRGGERFFSRPEIQGAIQAIRVEAVSPSSKPLDQTVSDIARSFGWQLQPPEEAGAARERWEALGALIQIVDELPDGSDIADFAKELEERQRSQHEPQKSAITLSTIHAAKGLEWDCVYLVGLNEGYLPISYATTPSAIAEERRLLYVGVTRARKELALSYPQADFEGGRTRQPSRFLSVFAPRS
jgi:DNA helicase-2/ATP-dependent DNA helicase PcrA